MVQGSDLTIPDALAQFSTQKGISLAALSDKSPLLLVFLRHFGWPYCTAAVLDIGKKRSEIAATGTQVAFVHMGNEEQAQKFFTKLGAQDEHRVSDPERKLYRAFSLQRGKLGQLFGLRIWKREIRDRIYLTHGIGRIIGDSFQLPGVFLIHHSEVLKAFRHDSIADNVDYVAMSR